MYEEIRFDFAPMEGITDYPYRSAHSRCFPGTDRYYSPFIAANQTCSMKTREKKDVAPEHNSGVVLVPQILTNHAEVFLWAVREMMDRGYATVNLNLGCPSATVVTRGKGAGFLADPEKLDRFFETVFDGLPEGAEVSVKTRIGMEDRREAGPLIEVFNRYPISELIVHPRLRKDFYRGEADLDSFGLFCASYTGALTYNGDIRSAGQLRDLLQRFPTVTRVMIGRGLIADPALIRELRGGPGPAVEELHRFHDEVLAGRMEELKDFNNAAGKMKELWFYMGPGFREAGRQLKSIKKARTYDEYRAATDWLFSTCSLSEDDNRNSFFLISDSS